MAQDKHERGANLIREAFARARDSGLPKWQTMHAAVLKNRLLDLTERSFSESDWDATSFRDFLKQFDDVVAVIPGAGPLQVALLQGNSSEGSVVVAESAGPPKDLGARRQVRKDLWDGIMDFSSGSRYAWDGERAIAVAAGDTEPSGSLWLPTLTEEEFKQWRSEFVSETSSRSPEDASILDSWLEQEEPLRALPTAIRIPWVVELKRRVLDRLKAWFRDEGLDPPADLVVSKDPSREGPVEADVLREHVLDAVRKMSRTELEALQLPATVLLRSKG